LVFVFVPRMCALKSHAVAAANDNLRSHSESATRALQAKQRQLDDSNDSFRRALPLAPSSIVHPSNAAM
jgi:hypothetical protein